MKKINFDDYLSNKPAKSKKPTKTQLKKEYKRGWNDAISHIYEMRVKRMEASLRNIK